MVRELGHTSLVRLFAVLVSTIRECPSTAAHLSSPALRGCLTSVRPVPSVHNTSPHKPHLPPSLVIKIINPTLNYQRIAVMTSLLVESLLALRA